ncbi:MAG: hypothetical protein OXC80_04175 [Gammaproteobacteria bacterium]|nr:hypothetical protein [Gammaproteobacteria bacterium]
MVVALAPAKCYSGSMDCVQWIGQDVVNEERFKSYMSSRVKARVEDDEADNQLASELRGMAMTDMETDFVEDLLSAVHEGKSWAIGEALAECVLADDETREICWPWNLAHDRRTPSASLPGADLVGFCKEGDTVLLLFGEVKTSSDPNTPPNVMYGSGGLARQIEEISTRSDIQQSLLMWLRVRCYSDEHRTLFEAAVHRYVQSLGKEMLLVGILLRDTKPNELDVANPSKALAKNLSSPTRVEINAWYLPVPINDWPALIYGRGAS